MSRKDKAALRRLVKVFKGRQSAYLTSSLERGQSIADRNRYEGISTGSRWAAEDLDKLIK